MGKNNVVAYVGWFLLAAAFGFYGYAMFEVVSATFKPTGVGKNISEVLTTTLSSIQALLLANLGIILGISISKPESRVARTMLFNAPNTNLAETENPMQMASKVQLFAVIIYILSLIICLVAWGYKKFVTDAAEVVPVVSESGKMFIGVVLAYLTAVLGVKQQQQPLPPQPPQE